MPAFIRVEETLENTFYRELRELWYNPSLSFIECNSKVHQQSRLRRKVMTQVTWHEKGHEQGHMTPSKVIWLSHNFLQHSHMTSNPPTSLPLPKLYPTASWRGSYKGYRHDSWCHSWVLSSRGHTLPPCDPCSSELALSLPVSLQKGMYNILLQVSWISNSTSFHLPSLPPRGGWTLTLRTWLCAGLDPIPRV